MVLWKVLISSMYRLNSGSKPFYDKYVINKSFPQWDFTSSSVEKVFFKIAQKMLA